MDIQRDWEKGPKVAYFSMEIALDPRIPTYSGGLGILAGDILRSSADLELPVVGITLAYTAGYFHQRISPDGIQYEKTVSWEPALELKRISREIDLMLAGRKVRIGAWLYTIVGCTGHTVPVYLLTTDMEGNHDSMRKVTGVLYDADTFVRLAQEFVLGIGGVKVLDKLGYTNIDTYHMNEGHSSLLSLELSKRFDGNIEKIRDLCVFTTHTPVPAGHEKYDGDLVEKILDQEYIGFLPPLMRENGLDMSKLALHFSRYVNAVSKKHGEVVADMFPQYCFDTITNGVHTFTWQHQRLLSLLTRYLPNLRNKPENMGIINNIQPEELWNVHQKIKRELIDHIKAHSKVDLSENILTIGFARRMTKYKRPQLITLDLDRLGRICKGKVQILMAGKAHPVDEAGKKIIKNLIRVSKYLLREYGVTLKFIDNYDIDLASRMVAGVDVWLNTPKRYLEASGTSGMKAALNGVLNFSVLDGWWIEAYSLVGGKGGWAIGPGPEEADAVNRTDEEDACDIYRVLEDEIIPTYYNCRDHWCEKMKHAISLGGYFNTHRVVQEYAEKAWRLSGELV